MAFHPWPVGPRDPELGMYKVVSERIENRQPDCLGIWDSDMELVPPTTPHSHTEAVLASFMSA